MQRKILKRPAVFCVVGTDRGVGVTHLALSIANYFSSAEHRRTAFIEIGERETISSLEEKEAYITEAVLPGFTKNRVDYYPAADPSSFSSDMLYCPKGRMYDRLVLDLRDASDLQKLLQQGPFPGGTDGSGLILVLGSASPWNISIFTKQVTLIQRLSCGYREVFFSWGCSGRERAAFRRACKRPLTPIPEIRDPFRLTRRDIKWLRDTL